ncbi:hypothetical protein BDV28DRAFT_135594 [Aspergillus coremiiformis]|uniref:Uncharacterized protein n=1 Tax=Aspergillus coremiiformis TaxID=138285 RepID=A0A5N6Z3D0_9EURO|nr:hypothetical protein BDV28DRAFT_135594 [Aspergillus coremiiformis]
MHVVKFASHFPIRSLFAEFCPPWYRTCADFGPFLCPTISRSCCECSLFRAEYQVAPIPAVRFHFGLSKDNLKLLQVTQLLSLKTRRRGRMVDVAQAQAQSLVRQIHGGLENMNRAFQECVNTLDDKH